jgi:pyridinium-3,5-bisthiocarboxylic acid mononucleotide nickel chelatase
MKGLHLHFDAPTGAAGDMTLGALFDLGVPIDAVQAVLAPLGQRFELQVRKTLRAGLAGTDVKVLVDGEREPHVHDDLPHAHDHHSHAHASGHPHRHYSDIRALVDRATQGRVRELALAIFDKIAVAEAKLHGVDVGGVMFHEVGAVDALVDVVGAAAAIDWLAPAAISAGPVAVGGGSVKAAHGRLPVPSPATLEICRAAGVATVHGGVDRELLTPTGAAILATIVGRWGAMPPMTPRAVGYGAGDMDLADRPNLLRAVLGEPLHGAAEAELVELAANLDDMSPELAEHVADRLFAAGALDVWWTPATMKKSRPAFVLGVLGAAAHREALVAIILEETTTLGVRWRPAWRETLGRRSETVTTAYGPVALKLGLRGERVANVAPEYESARAAARAHGVPLKEVYAAAISAYLRTAKP